jgi:predicted nucleotidyltransferase
MLSLYRGEKMKSVGLIVEYNPFHNGHKYHIEKAKEITGADVAIAVMSGNFLQRGEPAIFNKWVRTEAAIFNGVDIVIELPVLYSSQSAEIFATGAVAILNSLKVNHIVFGAESDNIEIIKTIAEAEKIEEKKSEMDEVIKREMNLGQSYPNAFAKAVKEILGYEEVLTPNNILGLEYLRALNRINSDIIPVAIKRENVGFYSTDISQNIASATAIRKKIFEGSLEEVMKTVPINCHDLLKKEIKENQMAKIEEYYNILKYSVLSQPEKLKYIQDIEQGFDIRIYKGMLKSKNFEQFFSEIITKRYTISRVYRILTHILLDIDIEITEKAKKTTPPYCRILGINGKGREYIRKIKKELEIFLISNIKNVDEKLSKHGTVMFEFDNRADEIYKILNYYEERKMPIVVE